MRTKAMTKFINDAISVEHDECVIWPFCKDKDGYGRLRMNGERRAHRAIYKAVKGGIPQACELMHVCDTPSCVNPRHLSPGTHKQNMQDMRAKGRAAVIQIDNRGEAHPLPPLLPCAGVCPACRGVFISHQPAPRGLFLFPPRRRKCPLKF